MWNGDLKKLENKNNKSDGRVYVFCTRAARGIITRGMTPDFYLEIANY
jgi:hypothetical protein